jgi:predicted Zn-dependent protease with MMP-like domain
MIVGILLGFLLGALLFIWIASRHPLYGWRKDLPGADKEAGFPSWGAPWEELVARADKSVEEAQGGLPDDVRASALEVPTLFEEWHPSREGVLGVYYNQGTVDASTRRGPIVLYLRAIESWCRRSRRDFDEQVRDTYLHELGHHVGWNEGQVQERGL